MKLCCCCHQLQPLAEFHNDKTAKDGHASRCKPCSRRKVREWKQDNPERNRENNRRSYQNRIDRERAQHRKYHAKNREKEKLYREATAKQRLEHRRGYAKANPELIREQSRAAYQRYKARHPERVREQGRLNTQGRRATKRSAGGKYTTEDVSKLHELQRGKRWWCGKKFKDGKYHIDHRVPLAKGGTNDISNIVLAHPRCNQSKNDKMPDEFMGRLL